MGRIVFLKNYLDPLFSLPSYCTVKLPPSWHSQGQYRRMNMALGCYDNDTLCLSGHASLPRPKLIVDGGTENFNKE
ncbi:MAG: hypothetical protein AAGA66_21565, partial [Bacteroidota bacterium]